MVSIILPAGVQLNDMHQGLTEIQALTPAEQLLDVGQLEFHVGRPAVVALARMGRRLHLPQQLVHLFDIELAAGAHRAVASHGTADRLQVLALVREFAAAGRSALVVSHDLNLAARTCDCVALLARGGLLATGPPAEVLTRENLRAAFDIEADILTAPDGAPLVVPSA